MISRDVGKDNLANLLEDVRLATDLAQDQRLACTTSLGGAGGGPIWSGGIRNPPMLTSSCLRGGAEGAFIVLHMGISTVRGPQMPDSSEISSKSQIDSRKSGFVRLRGWDAPISMILAPSTILAP